MKSERDGPSSMLPPWRAFPSMRADEFARAVTQGTVEAWFIQQWQPFWDSQGATQREAYLSHWQATDDWRSALATVSVAVDFDVEADAAESEAALARHRATVSQRRGLLSRIFGRKS